ncbi:MAG: hypothetical protein HY863_11695 [Chloroflexi bacterium]|nr:hypothetical protein [Chloroflexota bacterium]
MRKILLIAAFLPSAIFPLATFFIGLRNPSIFDAPSLLRISPIPAVLFILAFSAVLIFSKRSALLQKNSHGLVLFLLFTLGYFFMASVLNKPGINTNNIYFAADSGSWAQRMAGADGWKTGIRAVHPLTHLIFRPLTAILSILTSGDRFYANLILLAAAGGGCVFLMWKVVQWMTEDQNHAVLCASLLGLSASHMIFSSVIESYIFSTFFLLLFIWLLITNKPAYLLVAASVVTLGITITNVAQQVLTVLFVQRNAKRLIRTFALVLGFSVLLNLAAKSVYPLTEYFFIPQNLMGEQRFSQGIDINRIELIAEDFFVYNIVAPQPYLSIRNDTPRFNFLHGTILEYSWFGWPAVLLWVATLTLVLINFFKRNYPVKHNGLLISMAACLLFNFILHAGYGFEPFLYTADWTYALILIIAIILQNAAKRTWFIVMWLFFVLSILLNNIWLLYFIARKAGEYLV